MQKTLIEVIKEYKSCRDRMDLNQINYLIPIGTPVLVSYAGVYRRLPRNARWIPAIVLGHWGDSVIDTIVKVNAMAWHENRRYHLCNLNYKRPTDPKLEIEIKVISYCVRVDHTLLCMLSDKPHHPDFLGNAEYGTFLHEKLCEYNRSLKKICRL